MMLIVILRHKTSLSWTIHLIKESGQPRKCVHLLCFKCAEEAHLNLLKKDLPSHSLLTKKYKMCCLSVLLFYLACLQQPITADLCVIVVVGLS